MRLSPQLPNGQNIKTITTPVWQLLMENPPYGHEDCILKWQNQRSHLF
jgi:hypothetical protein